MFLGEFFCRTMRAPTSGSRARNERRCKRLGDSTGCDFFGFRQEAVFRFMGSAYFQRLAGFFFVGEIFFEPLMDTD